MSEHNNSPELTAEQAYQRLICELYENGPIKLVEANGHKDLVSGNGRVGCFRERFLDAMSVMYEHDLVRELKNEQQECMFMLTDKGYLTAVLLSHQNRSRCACDNCTYDLRKALEKLLRELQQEGPIQLVINEHHNHPHFLGSKIQLCCKQGPFLDAIGQIGRQGLVEMGEGFVFTLNTKGRLAAQLLQTPLAKVAKPHLN